MYLTPRNMTKDIIPIPKYLACDNPVDPMSRVLGEKFSFIGTILNIGREFLLIYSRAMIFINCDRNIDFPIPNVRLQYFQTANNFTKFYLFPFVNGWGCKRFWLFDSIKVWQGFEPSLLSFQTDVSTPCYVLTDFNHTIKPFKRQCIETFKLYVTYPTRWRSG